MKHPKKHQHTYRKGLSFLLPASFVGVAFVAMLFVVVFLSYSAIKIQNKVIFEEQRFAQQSISEKTLYMIEHMFHGLSGLVVIGEIASATPEEGKIMMQKLLDKDTKILRIAYFDIDGNVHYEVKQPSCYPDAALTVFITPTMLDTLKQGEKYITDLRLDRDICRQGILIAEPVRDQSGAVVGAVAEHLSIDFLRDILASLNMERNSIAYIIGADGSLVTPSTMEKKILAENQPYLDYIISSISTKHHEDKLSVNYGINGTRAATSYLYINSLGAVVVVESPLVDAYVDAIMMIKYILLAVFIAIILAIIVGIFVSRKIVEPIEQLRDEAAEISKGNLDVVVVPGPENEVGELAATFDNMRSKLKLFIHDIETEKAHLLSSIENLSIGFAILDLEGKIQMSNHILQELFGLKEVPHTVKDLDGAGMQDLIFSKLYSVAIDEQRRVEKPDVLIDGRNFKIDISPILLASGECIGAVILTEDITEKRAAARSKDEFFSIASHELRTPLTAIRGNASMLKEYYFEKPLDSDGKQMITDILDSSDRLIRIVNDFLDLSRIEQGRMQFKKEKIDLVQEVREVLDELTPIAEEKKIALRFNMKQNTALYALADKDRLKQVLVNLVANALNYTEKGSITITLNDCDDHIEVDITDTDIGIAPENQVLLFRKFQQAGGSIFTRNTTHGTGLGLFITKLMVEAMGGNITLRRSEVGKGSTFSFSLPHVKYGNTDEIDA